jgi:hypothetical protein
MYIYRRLHKMRRSTISILLLVTFLTLGFQSAVVTSFRAELNPANSNEITLKWTVSQADHVVGFRIQRSLRNEQSYDVIHAIQVNPGDVPTTGREYQYVDRSVFKPGDVGDAVFYKLFIVYNNGSVEEKGPVSVNYTSTAIRRTWGSIKSMFQ